MLVKNSQKCLHHPVFQPKESQREPFTSSEGVKYDAAVQGVFLCKTMRVRETELCQERDSSLYCMHFIEPELFTQLLVHKYCSGDEHLDV